MRVLAPGRMREELPVDLIVPKQPSSAVLQA